MTIGKRGALARLRCCKDSPHWTSLLLFSCCVLVSVIGCHSGKTADTQAADTKQAKASQPAPPQRASACAVQKDKEAAAAQLNAASGLQVEVREVSVLPHLDARYKTMKMIPKGTYRAWAMDAGSVVGQEVVSLPKGENDVWIEALILVRNTGTKNERFVFKTPHIELDNGQKVVPWEYLPAGLVERYDDIANTLQLSDKAPAIGSNEVHLRLGGELYSELKSKQQTWVIMIFQIPKEAKDGRLSISSYPPAAIDIPMSCE